MHCHGKGSRASKKLFAVNNERAFGNDVTQGRPGLQGQSGEAEGPAPQTGRWRETRPQVAPYPGLTLALPHTASWIALHRLEDSQGRKGGPDGGDVRCTPSPVGLQAPQSGRGSTLGNWGRSPGSKEGPGGGWGSWHPSSTTLLPNSSLVTSSSLSPLPIHYQHQPLPWVQEHRLRCQLPGMKGVCLYSKWAIAHSEAAHSQAAHVTAAPAQSPGGTDANLWLETFLNMSLAQRVRFPGLLGPGRPSQDC